MIRINFFVLFYIVFLLSLRSANASWLCKETSAVANGDYITTCGIASNSDLQKSRDLAFNAAESEFKRFCNPNPHCRDKEFKVEPMRVDCTQKDNIWTCYRALGFTILKEKKKNITVDIGHAKKDLKLKEMELQRLKDQLSILEKSKKIDDEVQKVQKSIAKYEADTILLKDKVSPESINGQEYNYVREKYDVSFKLSGLYYSFSSENIDYNIYGLGFKLEKRFFQRVGLNIGYEWGSNFKTTDDFPDNSTPNLSKAERGYTKVNKTSIGMTIYPYKNFYLSGEVGYINYETQFTTVQYTALGVKGSEKESTTTGKTNFQKVAIGYDSLADTSRGTGFFFEIGALKDDSKTNPHLGLGINLGF